MVMLSGQPEASEPSPSQNKNPGNALSRYWLPRILSVLLMPDCCSDYSLCTSCIPRRLLDLLELCKVIFIWYFYFFFKYQNQNPKTEGERQLYLRDHRTCGFSLLKGTNPALDLLTSPFIFFL